MAHNKPFSRGFREKNAVFTKDNNLKLDNKKVTIGTWQKIEICRRNEQLNFPVGLHCVLWKGIDLEEIVIILTD